MFHLNELITTRYSNTVHFKCSTEHQSSDEGQKSILKYYHQECDISGMHHQFCCMNSLLQILYNDKFTFQVIKILSVSYVKFILISKKLKATEYEKPHVQASSIINAILQVIHVYLLSFIRVCIIFLIQLQKCNCTKRVMNFLDINICRYKYIFSSV